VAPAEPTGPADSAALRAFVRARLVVTPGEALAVYSASPGDVGVPQTDSSYVRLASESNAYLVSVAGGSEQGISPGHFSVFAPEIAMERRGDGDSVAEVVRCWLPS
jgi:hypothetical protein